MIDTNGTSEDACTSTYPLSPKTDVSVKIGYSRKMKKRLDTYLLGSPVCLRVYGLIIIKNRSDTPNMMRGCEAYAHELLAKHHLIPSETRCHGHTLEWFRCSLDMLCQTFVRCAMYTQEYAISKNHGRTKHHRPYYMFSPRPYAHMFRATSYLSCPNTIRATPRKKEDDTAKKKIRTKGGHVVGNMVRTILTSHHIKSTTQPQSTPHTPRKIHFSTT